MAWKPGESGNPDGRPKGSHNLVTQQEMMTALRNVEKKRKINLLERFFERALKSDAVLVAVMKKLVPDLKALDMRLDLLVMQNKMSEGEAAIIRDKLASRMAIPGGTEDRILPSVEDAGFVDVNPLPSAVAKEVVGKKKESK